MNTEEQDQVKIEELDQAKNELKKHYLKGYRITVIVMLLIALLVKNGYSYFISIIIAGLIITNVSASKKKKAYRDIFKQYFVKKSLESVFTDINYLPESGMSFNKIASTQMMNMGDRYHSEDYVSAKYKDIPFEQADVLIEEEHTTIDSDRTNRKGICYDIQR